MTKIAVSAIIDQKNHIKMSNEQKINFVRNVRDKINSISPTFCLAKWTQSTIYLWNGQTHSCHHPGTHLIPIEGLESNPSQIHNTPYKQQLRLEMLNGVQIPECEYCWNVENLKKDYLSDRHTKSAEKWSLPYFDEIVMSGPGATFNPKYIEIGFENTCNFKCTYCFPHISSRIKEEIVAHGPYKLNNMTLHDLEYLKKNNQYPIGRKDDNPYIEAFWKWWPELYKGLDTFRITGGEPLLSKHTWAVMDYIIEHPRPNFTFAINTNFGIEGALVDKLIEKINKISELGIHVELFTSLESTGPQAEYARYGMDYSLFVNNVDKFLTHASEKVSLCFMTTVNILSATTFKEFLRYVFDLRCKYNLNFDKSRVRLSINYLRYPEFLALPNLPTDLKERYSQEWLEFINNHLKDTSPHKYARFYLEEKNALERMIEWMTTTSHWKAGNKEYQYSNFKIYHAEYDKRRGTEFIKVFPELFELFYE
jgi:sulfatase maturation enzyme AslB (radical SAM superfamily)